MTSPQIIPVPAALRAEPALPTLLRRLVIMGGSYDHRGNTTAVAEWNISVDPEAAAEVSRGVFRRDPRPVRGGPLLHA